MNQLLNAHSGLGWQFLRYALCGALAALAYLLVVYGLGLTINPAFDHSLGNDQRFARSAVNNTIGFIISNTVAYLLNIKYVFQPGKHSRTLEIGLFFLVSALGFFPSLFGLDLVIRRWGMDTNYGNAAFALTSASMNFICRKLIIFHR